MARLAPLLAPCAGGSLRLNRPRKWPLLQRRALRNHVRACKRVHRHDSSLQHVAQRVLGCPHASTSSYIRVSRKNVPSQRNSSFPLSGPPRSRFGSVSPLQVQLSYQRERERVREKGKERLHALPYIRDANVKLSAAISPHGQTLAIVSII